MFKNVLKTRSFAFESPRNRKGLFTISKLPTVSEENVKTQQQPYISNQVLKPRLEEHLKNNLEREMSVLLVENHLCKIMKSAGAQDRDREAKEYLDSLEKEINDFRGIHIENDLAKEEQVKTTFTTFLHNLPTAPNSHTSPFTAHLSPHLQTPSIKPTYTRPLPNPIDYTSVPSSLLYAPKDPPPHPKFTPLPHRIPRIQGIDLEITTEEAVSSKNILLSAIMSLQSISGVRGVPVFATKGDASKKIRVGMPIGAKVSMGSEEALHFLDKLVHCVFPRIREWEGLVPVCNDGMVEFTLAASTIGTFPDIEGHFDSFPRLFDTRVRIRTSGDTYEALLLLSGMQVVFMPSVPLVEEDGVVENDPWAMIKAAKTRDERKALFAAMQDKKKKEVDERKKKEDGSEQAL